MGTVGAVPSICGELRNTTDATPREHTVPVPTTMKYLLHFIPMTEANWLMVGNEKKKTTTTMHSLFDSHKLPIAAST
jgi:hypothetical protein